MPVELGVRDLEMMKSIFEQRVLTFDQLGRKFFPGRDKSTIRKRINRLCAEGLLKKKTLDLPDTSRKAVLLSERAWDTVKHRWGFEIENPHFQSKSPEHDVLLAEIVMRLKGLRCFKGYVSENVLQSSQAVAENPAFKELAFLQADGGLVVVDEAGNENVFAIEYEFSKKAPDRYEAKLLSYYATHELSGVLYVCSTQEVLSAVARIDQSVCKDRKGFVCSALEADVLKSPDRIHFPSATGEGVELF
jgi:hypothetical protein